jgi:hypothetical protein
VSHIVSEWATPNPSLSAPSSNPLCRAVTGAAPPPRPSLRGCQGRRRRGLFSCCSGRRRRAGSGSGRVPPHRRLTASCNVGNSHQLGSARRNRPTIACFWVLYSSDRGREFGKLGCPLNVKFLYGWSPTTEIGQQKVSSNEECLILRNVICVIRREKLSII